VSDSTPRTFAEQLDAAQSDEEFAQVISDLFVVLVRLEEEESH
jgi:hypothetical protein